MSEGSTLKPFPEARPPHLPDLATRQSPWLFLFGALIAVQIWRLFQGWDPQLNGANAVTAFNYVLSWAAAFAPPLMGFALFTGTLMRVAGCRSSFSGSCSSRSASS